MRIGCSTAGMVSGKLNPEMFILKTREGIEYFSQLSFDICEIYLRFPKKEYWISISNLSKKFGIPIYSAHFSKNIFHSTAGSSFRKHLLIADYLQCSVVVVHPPDLSNRVLYNMTKKLFQENLSFAEEHNIKMTVENVPYIPNCLDHLSDLVTQINSEFFGVTMDTEFVYSTGETVERYFDILDDYILHIHLRDYDGSPFDRNGRRRYLLPGRGNLDFSSILMTIKKHYHSDLIIEAPINDLKKLDTSQQFLRNLLKSP